MLRLAELIDENVKFIRRKYDARDKARISALPLLGLRKRTAPAGDTAGLCSCIEAGTGIGDAYINHVRRSLEIGGRRASARECLPERCATKSHAAKGMASDCAGDSPSRFSS